VAFCHLKRHHGEVYYHSNGGDTDFVVKKGMKVTKQIQVWHEDVSETAIPDRELACFRKQLEGNEAAETILLTNDYEVFSDQKVPQL
jgi:predicted AAA+ superfamily ATPase